MFTAALKEKNTQPTRASVTKTIGVDDGRRKREEQANSIRKSKREESLSKRREMAAPAWAEQHVQRLDVQLTAQVTPAIERLAEYVDAVKSEDIQRVLVGVLGLRKLLSIERNPPIAEVIQTGVVPRLVQLLARGDQATIQFEAAWALTNIASGTSVQTRTVVEAGAVQYFIQLLQSQNEELREQAVWALGNIAGDGTEMRDFVLRCNIVQALLMLIQQPNCKITLVRHSVWTMSNLCRGKPSPDMSLVAHCIPALVHLMSNSNDEEIIVDAAWAFSYLSDGQEQHIQAVLDSGVVPLMIRLLAHPTQLIQTPALRTLGNICTGNDRQTQQVLDAGLLPHLAPLLKSSRKAIRKETCWTLSNITAGNANQTQAVINAGLLPLIVEQMQSNDFEVKKEAAWAISNAVTWKNEQQVHGVVSCGALRLLVDMCDLNDARSLLVVLEAIENILSVGARESSKSGTKNQYATIVEECGGLDKLELLQEHQNQEVYERSVRIVESFFEVDSMGDENMMPIPTTQTQTFNFAINQQQQPNQGGFVF